VSSAHLKVIGLLALATFFNILISVLPYFYLVEGSDVFEKTIDLQRQIFFDFTNNRDEFINIFLLPMLAGMICLSVTITTLLWSRNIAFIRNFMLFSMLLIVILVAYFLYKNIDIHIMVVSLLPLYMAWHSTKESKEDKHEKIQPGKLG